ncbi:mitotic spindle assembly checkpoint protein MAD2A [Homalodisca vitripennis]|uniref:Mitotic spindle assembly checkpoint protein MAD2A n=1 Tax=Homalodisca liturata TaxID=320908 RepID=A0A1B6JJN5_9HEMI|nr:mitotic spindle assembly checkpoint protein MAD2A [Homalodisca vitripennis]
MTSSEQQTRSTITLKGSVELVVDYLNYGINSILFQRGIYPPESFNTEEHFGLSILVSTDDKIIGFLKSVLGQIKDWLLNEQVNKMSLVIANVNTKEVLERWDFKLEYEKPEGSATEGGEIIGKKDLKVIQKEIRDVLRQICSTVSFLPLLDCPCSFDLLIYTKKDCQVPNEWDETQPVFIANSQELQMRSFSTSLHKMHTIVSYKAE